MQHIERYPAAHGREHRRINCDPDGAQSRYPSWLDSFAGVSALQYLQLIVPCATAGWSFILFLPKLLDTSFQRGLDLCITLTVAPVDNKLETIRHIYERGVLCRGSPCKALQQLRY
jgi:hypothetical protein